MILLIYSLKQNYYPWFENEKRGDKKESIDKEESADLNDMPPLEGDEEEVKKGLKSLTPNKLLTRLTILLAKI